MPNSYLSDNEGVLNVNAANERMHGPRAGTVWWGLQGGAG